MPGGADASVRAIRPRWYFDGREGHASPVLGIDARWGQLAPHQGLPVEDVDGIVLPGLVNCHTHLEVGPLPRPAERGFLPWLQALQTAGGAYTGVDPDKFLGPALDRARTMHASGTGMVGDISNTGLTASVIAAAGMTGLCFHERVGIDVPSHPVLPDTVPVPHAVYSTHPDWIQACGRQMYWSIHLDEDPAEAEFLRGEGPWPAILKAFGRNLDGFTCPQLSPVAYLEQLGVLTYDGMLVHCVCTGPEDLDRIAAAHAPICLCIRSNLWIGGRLPDVLGMVDRGIRLVVGTDSLGSSPDLDLLAELAAIRRAFPSLAPDALLRMATDNGREALGVYDTRPLDRLVKRLYDPGPPLLFVEGPRTLDQLLDGTVWPRRWLAGTGVSA